MPMRGLSEMPLRLSRRELLGQGVAALSAISATALAGKTLASQTLAPRKLSFGLVTYNVGSHWDLPTLIANCERANVLGVELRTTHMHGVEPSLNSEQRGEVKKRFADSNVKLVGIGSNENLDSPDPSVLKQSIENCKAFIRLSRDVGGSGVKVKPNDFHEDVPHEKTINQVGQSLLELGRFGADYGQQIRLEVHGTCGQLPTIQAIMEIADHPNIAVCWNSNSTDLNGDGLEHNFKLVRGRFGDTCHVHRLDNRRYPYAQLMKLLVESQYEGWVMLEEGKPEKDPYSQLIRQRDLFEKMVAEANA
jgi:sugar phosphate isomerase/epimerase